MELAQYRHACRRCERPVKAVGHATSGNPEYAHLGPASHEPDVAEVVGWTTLRRPVFPVYATGDPHPKQRGVPPWRQWAPCSIANHQPGRPAGALTVRPEDWTDE
jgi:hypothetical protein